MKKTLKCKHCGNEDLFYTKEKYKGEFEFCMDKEGNPVFNADIHEGATYELRSKYIFCRECDKRVCKIDEFESGEE
ncbi:hypothetical protein [Peptostreptococcus stomatis]